jgi:dodecin
VTSVRDFLSLPFLTYFPPADILVLRSWSLEAANTIKGGETMSGSTYTIVELVGSSSKSWEDAAKLAIETAAGSLRDLRVAEVVKLDMTVENGKVSQYRARINVSFKYEKGKKA